MRTVSTLAALAMACIGTPALSQTPTDPGTAGSTTGTTTTQQEMNRGVPGVDVDVGRNAQGAIDVDRDRNTNVRNAPGVRRDAAGTGDMNEGTRPARDDRG